MVPRVTVMATTRHDIVEHGPGMAPKTLVEAVAIIRTSQSGCPVDQSSGWQHVTGLRHRP